MSFYSTILSMLLLISPCSSCKQVPIGANWGIMEAGSYTPPSTDTWAEFCGQWKAAYDKRWLGKALGRATSFLALSELPSSHQPGNVLNQYNPTISLLPIASCLPVTEPGLSCLDACKPKHPVDLSEIHVFRCHNDYPIDGFSPDHTASILRSKVHWPICFPNSSRLFPGKRFSWDEFPIHGSWLWLIVILDPSRDGSGVERFLPRIHWGHPCLSGSWKALNLWPQLAESTSTFVASAQPLDQTLMLCSWPGTWNWRGHGPQGNYVLLGFWQDPDALWWQIWDQEHQPYFCMEMYTYTKLPFLHQTHPS